MGKEFEDEAAAAGKRRAEKQAEMEKTELERRDKERLAVLERIEKERLAVLERREKQRLAVPGGYAHCFANFYTLAETIKHMGDEKFAVAQDSATKAFHEAMRAKNDGGKAYKTTATVRSRQRSSAAKKFGAVVPR